MIITDITIGSWSIDLVAKFFRRREVGIRLWSGALLFLLDFVLVVVLSCLIWFGWTPCCHLAAPSWQPYSSSWSASGAPLSDHGHWLIELGFLWWCLGVVLGVLETRWVKWMVWVVWCGCPCDVYLVLVQNSYLPCLPSEASHDCVMIILIGELFWYCHL
jgi:hypothetical protein